MSYREDQEAYEARRAIWDRNQEPLVNLIKKRCPHAKVEGDGWNGGLFVSVPRKHLAKFLEIAVYVKPDEFGTENGKYRLWWD